MVNLRLKDGKELSQDHIATEWQNQYSNPAGFSKKLFFQLVGDSTRPVVQAHGRPHHAPLCQQGEAVRE